MNIHGGNPINLYSKQNFGTKKYLSQYTTTTDIATFKDFQNPHVNRHSQQKTPSKWNVDGVVSRIQLEFM